MSEKKPSTSDILSSIRGGGSPSPKDNPDPAKADEASAAPESPSPPAAPAPTGTAGILAAIKSGGAGGASKPAAAAEGDAAAADSGGSKPAAPAPAGTAGILASIRGGGGAAKPAAATPAAGGKKPAAKSVDTAKAAGMSAAEMIKAARQGVVTADPVTGEPKPVAPKPVALPKKPLAKMPARSASAKSGSGETRRSALSTMLNVALSPVVVAWTSLAAATAASGLAMARFMMPNVLVEPPTKFKIGPLSDYGAGTVSTKWKAQFGVWIVNDEIDGQQMVYALSTVCTHLGCTPNWLEGEQKFKCPCHGSGFYKTGINFEGPAPRPLERHGIRLAEDGMLEVDKSVKFQRELGQWDNAASFVPV
ncbi:MAG: Rieske (2Fe-2S) protein [Fuerstiella sp.]